jgi:hypothetical protein
MRKIWAGLVSGLLYVCFWLISVAEALTVNSDVGQAGSHYRAAKEVWLSNASFGAR